jgi:predicted glycosyltransferase
MFWLTLRAAQLFPLIMKEKPDLALSHGSRSQILLANFLKIPSVVIFDYEFSKGIPLINPDWAISPNIISDEIYNGKTKILKYQGIKEDVYIPFFKPDNKIKNELGLDENKIIITIRPPATEAHYFKIDSEKLFEAALDFLCKKENIQIILLPRSEGQKEFIIKKWAYWFSNSKIIIPEFAVDGLNLIWHSDLVISGGGTMNREAAALGVPVYSIFRGKIGAVDKYLSDEGRLILIEDEKDIREKILLKHRDRSINSIRQNNNALKTILNYIESILNNSKIK